MRIQDGEVGGPEELAEVAGDGDGGVGQPAGQRLVQAEGAAGVLGEEGDDGGGEHGRQEGQLFPDERPDIPARRPGQTPQRPDVEQQEQAREGDEHRLGQQPGHEGGEGQGVPAAGPGEPVAPARGVSDPRVQGKQAQEGGEQVLAFRDPDDGLDPQGMPGKEGGGHGAHPEGPGQVPEEEEDEHGVDGMQQHAGGVVAERIEAEERAVELVREPGERVPVGGVKGGEGPDGSLRGESGADVWILRDVGGVVEVDEAAAERAAEHQPGAGEQDQRDGPRGKRGAGRRVRVGGGRGHVTGRGSTRRRALESANAGRERPAVGLGFGRKTAIVPA